MPQNARQRHPHRRIVLDHEHDRPARRRSQPLRFLHEGLGIALHPAVGPVGDRLRRVTAGADQQRRGVDARGDLAEALEELQPVHVDEFHPYGDEVGESAPDLAQGLGAFRPRDDLPALMLELRLEQAQRVRIFLYH